MKSMRKLLLLILLVVTNVCFAREDTVHLRKKVAQFYLGRYYERNYLKEKTEAQDSIILLLEEKIEAQTFIINQKDSISFNLEDRIKISNEVCTLQIEQKKKEIKKYKRQKVIAYSITGLSLLLVIKEKGD